MKIITGIAKGKRLRTLEGDDTRPTSERIKEAVFSSIQFDVEHRDVLDLFAGCGQMGLEAISRGATGAMFIDASMEAMSVIKENAKTVGFFDRGRYLVSDYRNYIRKAAGRDTFDLVFIDPPYAMMCCAEAVDRLCAAGMLRRGALVVLECGEEDLSDPSSRFPDFDVLKDTQYGRKTHVLILFYRGKDKGEDACE